MTRHRHPGEDQEQRAPQALAGRRADHHRRRARDPALLRSRRQRLHHQAGQLRELRQRHPPARPVPVGDAGAGDASERPAPAASSTSTTIRASAGWSQRALGLAGFAVEYAASGEDGSRLRRTKAASTSSRLDHYMPGRRPGSTCWPRIRALPDAPPVIYVTGSEDAGSRWRR